MENPIVTTEPAASKGKSCKLNYPWIGPFRVAKKLSDIVYHIQNNRNRRKRKGYILTGLSHVTLI